MVGVAGRSKGCVTCRKRKKGCDLQQPECGQCKERGILCSGYDTDRVFVYHNVGKKRPTDRTPGTPHSGLLPDIEASSGVQPQLLDDPMQVVCLKSDISQDLNASALLPFVLPLSLTQSAYGEKSLEAFMTMYIPGGDLRSMSAEGKDLVGIIPQLTNSEEALRLAVLAIGTVALGNQTKDAGLTRHGRSVYGKALMETRRALQNPYRARSTAMLTIPHVMALFEIFFGADANSSKQAQSWLSHAEGEIALIVARGPKAFIEDPAHSIFVNARHRPLIASSRVRKRSVLNETRWKTIPWRGRDKSPNDHLLDIWAAVPEVLENVDRFGTLNPDTLEGRAEDLKTAAKCWTLHIKLQAWLVAYEHGIHTPVTTTATPITFSSFEVACLTIRYWVISLLLYSSLDTATRIPISDTDLTHHDRPHPRQFARLIARSASYFFREEFGMGGPATVSFPLGNALLYFRREPVLDAEFLWLIKKTWGDPNLPSAIKSFLDSLSASVTTPTPAKALTET